jgi:hypothetical protein
MRLYPEIRAALEEIAGHTVNLLSLLYSSIYPPTYTNELKELGRFLGFGWSNEESSGIQSIAWRKKWELSCDAVYKDMSSIYNNEDCQVLIVVKKWIHRLLLDKCQDQPCDHIHPREIPWNSDGVLDEYISAILKGDLPSNSSCIKAPGPLITPDFVVLRPGICKGSTSQQLRDDLSKIIAVEVKKLERAKSGVIARESGLDYNTTPPCGTVRIYDSANRPLDTRCFYLFICQETDLDRKGYFRLTALVLCDGNVLNQDYDFYLSIVGERTKQIGLGTYKDGFNRQRPMLVFANPLGAKEMDRQGRACPP